MKEADIFYIGTTDLKKIPECSGIYQFKDKAGKIIYIGKAKNLRKRISQYLYRRDSRPLAAYLMKRSFSIEMILTGSESEALVLESHLIKKNQPLFNINLKDDKSYPYLAVTDEKWPRLVITRDIRKKYLFIKGPFTQVSLLHSLKELLQSLYPLKHCSKKFPQGCINGQMGLCNAPCKEDLVVNDENTKAVIDILKGKKWRDLSEIISEKIEKAVKDLNFEKASALKNALSVLPEIKRSFGVEFSGKGIEDHFLFKKEGDYLFVTVARYSDGALSFLRTFCGKILFDSMESCIAAGVASYYENMPVPEKISVVPDIIEFDRLNKVLGHKVAKKAKSYKKVFEILKKNMEQNIRTVFIEEEKRTLMLKDMSDFAKTDVSTILCVDVSTLGGEHTTAGAVWWEEGKFIRSKYRRFKIKSVTGVDDFQSLAEVAERLKKKWDNDAFEIPSLMLVDGGRGQLSAVENILNDSITVLGIIKDRKNEKGREILINKKGETVELTDSILANTLKMIRNEAHRFALEHNRSLRNNKLRTLLKEIRGVGEKREKLLLFHFRTIEKIKKASISELSVVPGVSASIAEKIFNHFRK